MYCSFLKKCNSLLDISVVAKFAALEKLAGVVAIAAGVTCDIHRHVHVNFFLVKMRWFQYLTSTPVPNLVKVISHPASLRLTTE